ncbi:hypothetical protein K502DRAFT_351807 [Neoconidiobolus thromboides FSU 785]|nr:hypothetical protein K502DRAFT_351807 [Neoconidiobolus thromboides FSU 785]
MSLKITTLLNKGLGSVMVLLATAFISEVYIRENTVIILFAASTFAQAYGSGDSCKDITKVVTSTATAYVTKTVQGTCPTIAPYY